MRPYSIILPSFWTGETSREIKKIGVEARSVALYLITSPHANMLGVYYLPISYISFDMGIPIEGASKALRSLCEIGFCSYDNKAEYVWIRRMAYYQVGSKLDPKEKRIKSVNKIYDSLPNLSFLNDFYKMYCEDFYLAPR